MTQQFLRWYMRKRIRSLIVIVVSKSKPSSPPLKWETRQGRVYHLNGESSGWDFNVSNERQ